MINQATEILGVRKLTSSFRRMIQVMAWTLPTLFVFIKMNIPDLINHSRPSEIMQITFGLWFFSWLHGLGLDINMQEEVYLRDPQAGKISRSIYVNFALMLLIAAILIAVINHPAYLAISLTVFSILSIIGFQRFGRRASVVMEASMVSFVEMNDRLRIQQLNCLKEYLHGDWTRTRAYSLLVLLIPVDLLCLSPKLTHMLTEATVCHFTTISSEALNGIVPTLTIVAFLVFAEGWQWKRRIAAWATISALAKLDWA